MATVELRAGVWVVECYRCRVLVPDPPGLIACPGRGWSSVVGAAIVRWGLAEDLKDAHEIMHAREDR